MQTLGEQLAALRAKDGRLLKPAVAEKMERHIAQLRADDFVARALKAGDRAPAFSLLDQFGPEVSSASFLQRGPLVVSFFRGTWCPYCTTELAALAAAYDRIRAAGADMVLVTPQSARDATPYLAQHPVPFSILVDPNADVAEAFGLAYDVPDYLRDVYRDVFKNDLSFVNAGNSWRLPIPGRYVIQPDGVISRADVNPDYRYRPEPDVTIAILEAIAAGRTAS
jgi:peroxiredoxin